MKPSAFIDAQMGGPGRLLAGVSDGDLEEILGPSEDDTPDD